MADYDEMSFPALQQCVQVALIVSDACRDTSSQIILIQVSSGP